MLTMHAKFYANPISLSLSLYIYIYMDSRCSNHRTGDEEKLFGMSNNSRLPITHIGNKVSVPCFGPHEVQLQNVYHVPGMKKNSFLVFDCLDIWLV
jgi:hypothetical protein